MKKVPIMAKMLPLALLPFLAQSIRCQIPDSLQNKAPIAYEISDSAYASKASIFSNIVAPNTSISPNIFSPKNENLQLFKTPLTLDSALMQKLRLAFLDEIRVLRKKRGKTSSPTLNDDYSETAQDYATLLAALPIKERSHYTTNIQRRLWHLQTQEGTDPFSVRECIHSHTAFISINDTAALLEEARISARAFFSALTQNNAGEMVYAHRQILNGNISLAGVGIAFNEYPGAIEITVVSITGKKKK